MGQRAARAGSRSEVMGATLGGESGVEAEDEWEVEMEAEVEGGARGVPLTSSIFQYIPSGFNQDVCN